MQLVLANAGQWKLSRDMLFMGAQYALWMRLEGR